MTYWNPIERYGVDAFAADLAAAGGAGVITPDLIPDEAGPWIAATDAAGIDTGLPGRALVDAASGSPGWPRSPTRLRLRRLDDGRHRRARPSVDGVAAGAGRPGARRATDRPVCVGLGRLAPARRPPRSPRYADGVIVGSAFVRLPARRGDAGGRRRRRRRAGRRARRRRPRSGVHVVPRPAGNFRDVRRVCRARARPPQPCPRRRVRDSSRGRPCCDGAGAGRAVTVLRSPGAPPPSLGRPPSLAPR